MKSFKNYMKEETVPYANVRSGTMDITDSAVRDQLNQLLSIATDSKYITPYIALEKVAKVLANFHIFIPSQHFLEGDSGALIWPINQFGVKAGMNNDGQYVVDGEYRKDYTHGPHVEGEDNEMKPASTDAEYNIFFEYRQGDCGMFQVFCEVVDREELSEIMDDLEAELNDEDSEDNKDEDEDEKDRIYEENLHEVSKKLVSRYLMKNRKQLEKGGMPAKKNIKRFVMRNLALKKQYPDSNGVGGKEAKVPSTGNDYGSLDSVAIGIRKAEAKKKQQIDEVSRKTLDSYHEKATAQSNKLFKKVVDNVATDDEKRKQKNRNRGSILAHKKITSIKTNRPGDVKVPGTGEPVKAIDKALLAISTRFSPENLKKDHEEVERKRANDPKFNAWLKARGRENPYKKKD